MSDLVKLDTSYRNVAVITLNRQDAANALAKSLLDELNQVIEEVDADSSIHCTILTGAGEKAFCAGADLKERMGMSDAQVVDAVKYIGETVDALARMRMPTIAAINGAAYGGGLELALACDMRIASDKAKMGLTETSLAIIPGAGGTQRLPRLIGPGQAKRLIFTAKPITAGEAFSIGLVEQIFPQDSLMEETVYVAEKIAANGPLALALAKKSIDRGMQEDLPKGLHVEHECYKQTIPTEDRKEGLLAFKEKRKPQYIGK